MTQLIPITPLNEHNQPIVDATRHNSAIRLAKGKYQRLRRASSAPLIIMFLLGPWLTINDAPLLWMDLNNHVLHLFGVIFWPNDLLILTWIAMASAFALFITANIAGRVWCGFSCPQTVWSMMFTWVEEKTQGSRNNRLKEASKSWTKRNWLALIFKHSTWMLIAFITGFTFVAYFETGLGLWQQLSSANLNHELIFWLSFFSILTYINAGWLREQVCLHMCPYARFQSVMVDKHTLKVSYDVTRGEPRKHPTIHSGFLNSNATGDCINCQICVQVCPVGIDIRQGLQYACIDCGACIDACDTVMDSIEKPRGLIHFSTEDVRTASCASQLKSIKNWRPQQRPRLWGYIAALLLAIALFSLQILTKAEYEMHLSRDRGQLYFYQELNISNAFTFSVQNKTQQSATFTIEPIESHLFIAGGNTLHLISGQKASLPIILSCKENCPINGKQMVSFLVKKNGVTQATVKGTFFAPNVL